MDPLLLKDARKIESAMRTLLIELENTANEMDAAALRESLKHVAGGVQQLARLLMVVAAASEEQPLEFELPPDPAAPAESARS